MNKTERVDAVLAGRQPDRPPFSFWYHFGPDEAFGPKALEAHLRHVETYDLDFLKIMDDNRYPRPETSSGIIQGPADLDRLTVLGGDEDTFGRQLHLIGRLVHRLCGELRMATTVFNSWTTLRNLTGPDPGHHGPPTLEKGQDPRDLMMSRLLREAPEALAHALEVITESQVNFLKLALDMGVGGVFLSTRDDWVDTPENGAGTYDRLVQPTDLNLLASCQRGAFNMLHVCGKALNFRRFADYPVHVLNWADRYAGPTIAETAPWVRPALCGGLDNLGTMVRGTPEDCALEVADALRQATGRAILISPGCTFDPQAVPSENLQAIRKAVGA